MIVRANMDTRAYMALLTRTREAIKDASFQANEDSAKQHGPKLKRNVHKHHIAPHIADTVTVTRGDASTGEWVVSIGSPSLPYAAALEFGHRLKGRFIRGIRYFIPLVILMRKAHRRRANRYIKRATRQLGWR